MSERVLIVNADDFGASRGISEGIVHCHVHGPLTSTSLMVYGKYAREAVALAREHPGLGLGLHWDLDGQEAPEIDVADPAAVREELARQLEIFKDLTGTAPTHIDAHHHMHREEHIAPVARELAAPLGVPLRDDGRVNFVGGFYGQWEWLVTDLSHIKPEFLIWILRNEVPEGWTEVSCHPGFVTGQYAGEYSSPYLSEREVELHSLCDPAVRAEIDSLGIRLANYAEIPA